MCISCKIDGQEVHCAPGTTILEAAKTACIKIPSLCYFKNLNQIGACRICVVEVQGMPRLMASCTTQVTDGMVISTHSEQVLAARKKTLDLICKQHRMDCEYCPNYTFCELHAVVRQLGLDDRTYSQTYHTREADESSQSIVRDYSKCIRCRRCVAVCKRQGVEAVGPLYRAGRTKIGTLLSISETNCIGCGQCVRHCPTGALFVKDDSDQLWRAQNNRKKIVLGIMPETANNIGCFFGTKEARNELPRLTAICKKIGAFEVLDLAGLRELALSEIEPEIMRRKANGEGDISASICPAEKYRYDRRKDIVVGKSLEELFRDRAINFLEGRGIDTADLFLVYVSACTAAKRSYVCDAVLTTTELFQWIQRACVSKYTTLSVWNTSREVDPVRLLPDVSDKPEINGINLISACPDGCRDGGGQFRIQGIQK